MSIDALFRARCALFRMLAIASVVVIGGALVLSIAVPILRRDVAVTNEWFARGLLTRLPDLIYLSAILFIGQAMGRLAHGRSIQPTLATALRRVGAALAFGGIASMAVVINLLRWLNDGHGSYLNFDVAGLTLAMIGLALILLGEVVDRAAAMQAELDEII